MNDTTSTKTTETNKPIHKIRVGRIAVSIWENASDDGKATYRASLAKTYRDYRGNWQETSSFRSDDLILVSAVARLAADWMIARENEL